ncbi:hypothetical protein BH10CHL1_BH10CHL1_43930 [soil metagenome]
MNKQLPSEALAQNQALNTAEPLQHSNNVVSLAGGFTAWTAADLPTSKASNPAS